MFSRKILLLSLAVALIALTTTSVRADDPKSKKQPPPKTDPDAVSELHISITTGNDDVRRESQVTFYVILAEKKGDLKGGDKGDPKGGKGDPKGDSKGGGKGDPKGGKGDPKGDKKGDKKDDHKITLNMNHGASWANGSTHTSVLRLPRDTKLKDIQEIGVHFVSGHPSAFDTADNWNMQSITVRAGNDKGHVLVEKAGNPLWRFSGGHEQDWKFTLRK